MFILQLDRHTGFYGECICGVSKCNEWKAAEIHTRTNNGKLLMTGIMILHINLQNFRYATYKDYVCDFCFYECTSHLSLHSIMSV